MKVARNTHTDISLLPQYESLFRQGTAVGWWGSDLAFSMPLDSNRILWLFGDTFVHSLENTNGRNGTTIINNSIALQTGNLSHGNAALSFHWKNKHSVSPQSFFSFHGRPGFLWPFSAVLVHKKLYVFAVRIIHTNPTDVFGFQQIGNEIICIPNHHESPEKWDMEFFTLPWDRNIGSFGSTLLIDNEFLYIYGFRQHKNIWRKIKFIVARINIQSNNDITNMTTWEFYNSVDNTWYSDIHAMNYVFDNSTTELSVSYLPRLDKYILVANSYKYPNPISIRLADTPYGPFTRPEVVYYCPETLWNSRYFCYAAKAHPELAQKNDELIITYATNSRNLQDCYDDLRIYFPRFIRVSFS